MNTKPHWTRRRLLGAAITAACGTAATAVARAAAHATADAAGAGPLAIGIVGSGNVGGAVGRLWVRAGHRVMFASRNPQQLQPLAAALGPLATVGSPAEAAAFGDVVFVAVPYGALPQVGRDLAPVWRGKVVLEAGNAIVGRDDPALIDRVVREGVGTVSADLLPGVRLVRAFNNLTWTRLAPAAHREPRTGLPIAGDDADALRMAQRLVRDAGYEPVVVGGLADARVFQTNEPGWRISKEELPANALRDRLAALKR